MVENRVDCRVRTSSLDALRAFVSCELESDSSHEKLRSAQIRLAAAEGYQVLLVEFADAQVPRGAIINGGMVGWAVYGGRDYLYDGRGKRLGEFFHFTVDSCLAGGVEHVRHLMYVLLPPAAV